MKPDLLDILICPECKGKLDLVVSEKENEEIIEGSLTCQSCSEVYPIRDSIPNMLPPALRD